MRAYFLSPLLVTLLFLPERAEALESGAWTGNEATQFVSLVGDTFEGWLGAAALPSVQNGSSWAGNTHVSFELGLRAYGVSVGGLLRSSHYQYVGQSVAYAQQVRSMWVGYHHRVTPQSRLGVLAGTNYYRESIPASIDGALPESDPEGILLGVSYELRAPRLWVRLTPNYVFPKSSPSYEPGIFKSGIPWVEVGTSLTPWLDVSLQFLESPLKVTVRL